mmetsp:Transcript_35703/g.43061  ORF Transcript_35703/g.43061 Transcript_35703/m.43061 type:complete len:400 (+) Transcript_35703:913-2112(+)
MTNLVVCNKALSLRVGHWSSFHTSNNTVDAIINFLQCDGIKVTAAAEDGSFIQQVSEVSSAEAWGAQGNHFKVNVTGQLLVAGMHLEDLLTSLEVRHINSDLTIETSRTEQSTVKDISSVCGCNDDHTSVALETIHLGKQLVKSLLSLVIATTDTTSTRSANSINLINEDDARSILLCLLKQVTNAGSTNTDEHLHKLGTRDREERDTSLSCNSLCQQGLSGTRGSDQQDTLGDASTNSGEALRPLQELDNLHEILLGFVHASHIIEHNTSVGLHLELSLGLSEGHGVILSTGSHTTLLRSAGEQKEASNQQQWESEVAQEVEEDGTTILFVGVCSEVDVLFPELGEQLLASSWKLNADALDAVAKLGANNFNNSDSSVLVQIDLLDTVNIEVLQEARV